MPNEKLVKLAAMASALASNAATLASAMLACLEEKPTSHNRAASIALKGIASKSKAKKQKRKMKKAKKVAPKAEVETKAVESK